MTVLIQRSEGSGIINCQIIYLPQLPQVWKNVILDIIYDFICTQSLTYNNILHQAALCHLCTPRFCELDGECAYSLTVPIDEEAYVTLRVIVSSRDTYAFKAAVPTAAESGYTLSGIRYQGTL